MATEKEKREREAREERREKKCCFFSFFLSLSPTDAAYVGSDSSQKNRRCTQSFFLGTKKREQE
jgi:hypothetical protein